MSGGRIALMAVLLALQACDAFTTRGALRHGAVEANALVGILGLWQAKLAAGAIAVWLCWRCRRSWLLWLAVGCYVLVVANNLLVEGV